MRGKGGAVEWSVGKLMSIVLLVILLVLIVYGVSSGGLIPLKDRVEGMVNEVLLMFGDGDNGGDGVECLDESDVFIEGVGDGKIIYCKGYCEIRMDNDFKFADLNSNRFKYNIDSGVMNDGGVKDDGKWHSFDQSFVGLDVDKINIVGQLYKSYKGAYEKYFNIHKRSRVDMSLELRSEFKIYIRIGANLYRWMEDLASWEVCSSRVGDKNIEEYCFSDEKGRWDIRVGDGWESVEDYGEEFNYFDKLMVGWRSGNDFWYSTDFTNLIWEKNPTLILMQEVREKEIEKYEDGLNLEFKELLDYDLQGGKFSVDVVGVVNSPIVVVNDEVGNKRAIVQIKMSGYLNDVGVDVVAPDGSNAFFYAVEKMSDKELDDVIRLNKIYEFLKDKC
ncbi:MAG: hypothetical protein V1889_00590 [archaeon]